MTTAPQPETLALAEQALTAMFDAWEAEGGPSPSMYDEHEAVAVAFGMPTKGYMSDAWYNRRCDCLNMAQLANLHLELMAS